METIDDETSAAAIDFIERQAKAGKPFFCWFNCHAHAPAHACPAGQRGQPGLTARTEYADGMVEHDGHVGKLLKKLDDLGIANDTIVIYTTDNGPHKNTWPDARDDAVPQREEHQLGGRLPRPGMIRWPGQIKPGSVSNEIVSGLDWFPTLVAAAGDAGHQGEAAEGHQAGAKTFKVHLDGYNQLPYLTGQQPKRPAQGVLLLQRRRRARRLALRELEGRVLEQRAPGTLRVWAEPFTPLRVPKMFDLRADPYERADITSNTYYDWLISQAYIIRTAPQAVRQFLATFKDYPPSQRAASFSVDQIVEKMQKTLDAMSK